MKFLDGQNENQAKLIRLVVIIIHDTYAIEKKHECV
jgi:hypothetical protein